MSRIKKTVNNHSLNQKSELNGSPPKPPKPDDQENDYDPGDFPVDALPPILRWCDPPKSYHLQREVIGINR